MVADEIEHGKQFSAWAQPEPAPQLLQEQGSGLRRTEEEDRIDLGDVHALAEHVRHENPPERAVWVAEPSIDLLALLDRLIAEHDRRGFSAPIERLRHEARMFAAGAESDRRALRS